MRTLDGINRFCFLFCEGEGSVFYFLLQESLMSDLVVRLRFLIASFTLLKEGSCHAQFYQGPWIADWVCDVTVNSIGEQE